MQNFLHCNIIIINNVMSIVINIQNTTEPLILTGWDTSYIIEKILLYA